MKIVRAESRHMDGIMEIERTSFPDPWSEESVRGYLDDPFTRVLVLEDGGAAAGFAIFHVSFEDAELYNIAVRETHRRRGAGRQLLDAALKGAEKMGAERMFLEVRKSNAPAAALYRAAGFTVCGVRRNYYDAPREDALLMDISLTESGDRT